jgi:hypothetical protein
LNLLEQKANVYSQNGEDGVIGAILEAIRPGTRWCCEFGAWDGIHFSNTRALVESGWSALLIEGDEGKYQELVANCAGFPAAHTYCRMVDAQTLDELLGVAGAPTLDLLVIDIDGLDYEVLSGIAARPRIVCVEVNAGHSPEERTLLPREVAMANVGQPFGAFHDLMVQRGYQLTAYTGNAFYVLATDDLPALTPTEAYRAFLEALSYEEKRWLYLVNRGLVPPFRQFANPALSRSALGLRPSESLRATANAAVQFVRRARS